MSSLLFDLYGVLLRTQSEEAKRRIEWAVVGDESIWSTYWDLRPAYDAGLVSDTNYWQQLRLRTGLPDFDIFEAVAADEASWLEADEEMVDYVLSLIGSGWRVGILANIPEGLAKKVRRKFPWLAEFAAVTFSADIGVAKPDEKAYTWPLTRWVRSSGRRSSSMTKRSTSRPPNNWVCGGSCSPALNRYAPW